MFEIKNPSFYWLNKEMFILAFDGGIDDDGDEYSYQIQYLKESGEFCFVENTEISGAAEKIEEFVVFRWNRKYPGDAGPDMLPWESGFFCAGCEEFPGNSHEKITMEIWRKEE